LVRTVLSTILCLWALTLCAAADPAPTHEDILKECRKVLDAPAFPYSTFSRKYVERNGPLDGVKVPSSDEGCYIRKRNDSELLFRLIFLEKIDGKKVVAKDVWKLEDEAKVGDTHRLDVFVRNQQGWFRETRTLKVESIGEVTTPKLIRSKDPMEGWDRVDSPLSKPPLKLFARRSKERHQLILRCTYDREGMLPVETVKVEIGDEAFELSERRPDLEARVSGRDETDIDIFCFDLSERRDIVSAILSTSSKEEVSSKEANLRFEGKGVSAELDISSSLPGARQIVRAYYVDRFAKK